MQKALLIFVVSNAFLMLIFSLYVRAEFSQISEDYKTYLLEGYEDTYFPEKAIGAGKAVYVVRNRDMINQSRFCIVYYREDYSPKNRKSGTKTALDYAIKKNKEIIIFPQQKIVHIGRHRGKIPQSKLFVKTLSFQAVFTSPL